MSDIEGSTRLVAAAGDRFAALLDRHFAIMRAAIEAQSGTIVSTEGDSVFAVLPTARAAISAAIAAQRGLTEEPWPEGLELRVRIGIHVGKAVFGGRDYTGIDVHRAARIMATAWGGEIVVSEATRSLVGDTLGADVTVRDLGFHSLRDIADLEHLYQIIAPDLRAEFPPPRTESAAAPTNLPTPLTRFVGRAHELAEIGQLLTAERLITLTGPGGTGKTRLAIEAGRGALTNFSSGVFFVALDTVRDPDLVVPQIAQTLGLVEDAARPIADTLAAYFAGKRLLLILDNLEQVISAAPQIAALVGATPSLVILGSSRESLGVAGERVYPVPTLTLPSEPGNPTAAQVAGLEAVELFVERAQAARPEFRLTDENAPAVAAICRRADGLPLAIELAAARVNVLTAAQILERLDHRLTLLAGSRRDVTDRQRTLRGAIDWSHDLLAVDEKCGFRRFSVFVGGADLDGVLAVLDPERTLSVDTIDLLAALVARSLLRSASDEQGARFAMLETIREYAQEQLTTSGEETEVRDRHAAYYAALASSAKDVLFVPDRNARLDQLELEMPNLRAALEWSMTRNDPVGAGSMAVGLKDYWRTRNHLGESRRWVDRILESWPDGGPIKARADLLGVGAELASWNTDYATSRAMVNTQIALLDGIGDKSGLAYAYDSLAWSYLMQDPAQARDTFEKALRLAVEAADPANELAALQGLGLALLRLGDLEGAHRISVSAIDKGDHFKDEYTKAFNMITLGSVEMRGNYPLAAEWYTNALNRSNAAGAQIGVEIGLDSLAVLLIECGADLEVAARLAFVAERIRRELGGAPTVELGGVQLPLSRIRESDPDVVERAEAAAVGTTTEQAVALAVSAAQRIAESAPRQ